MKKKNIIILWNYIKMIFNIRKIKKNIQHLEKENQLFNELWDNIIINPKNRDIVLNAFKKIENKSQDLQILQNYLLYLLKNFDKICKEQNINYWLRGGSLLGAIRHEGFIPWDDDLDIGMTRNDFKTLKNFLDSEKNNTDFKIQNYYNTTTAICRMPRFINAKNNINIFIDIFPFDYCSTNKNMAIKEYDLKQKTIHEKIKSLTRKHIINNYLGLMQENTQKDANLLNAIYEENTNYNQQKTSSLMYPFDWFKIEQYLYYNIDDIFPLKKITFNGFETYIPNNYSYALNLYYGNYLKPPSIQINHVKVHNLLNNKDKIKTFLENINTQ